jgi:hypothetical protein
MVLGIEPRASCMLHKYYLVSHTPPHEQVNLKNKKLHCVRLLVAEIVVFIGMTKESTVLWPHILSILHVPNILGLT